MGVDWFVSAVIGCEVPSSKLFVETVLEPGCEHHTSGRVGPFDFKYKHCPECGKPARRVERQPVAGYDHDQATLGDLVVAFTTDNARAFAGLGVTVAAGDSGQRVGREPMTADELAKAYDQVRAVLEPLGLWSPQDFGLWAVPRVSY